MGATGLTGSHLLVRLLEDNHYQKLVIYVRKTTGIRHPKLTEILIDYDTCEDSVAADDVFCCLGTTIKKAKTKDAFTKVDLVYPVKVAQQQKKAGSKKFLVISAMGANSSSAIFYSRVKGEMEAQLQQIGYDSLFIFRPSFITGNRKENRSGESMGIWLFKLISPLLLGPLKKYRPVSADSIAKCMLVMAESENKGTRVLLSDEIAVLS